MQLYEFADFDKKMDGGHVNRSNEHDKDVNRSNELM